MERFEDLMGITHHTGDAWLDKKLNQNTVYIKKLAQKIFGSGKVKTYGGDFAKGIRPYATQGLEDLQSVYEQGPRVFQGERVAGFDPLQEQAQSGIVGLLGTTDPYTLRQQQLLETALDQGLLDRSAYQASLGRAEESLGAGTGFLEDFSRGLGRAEESMGTTRGLLTDFQTGLGRTEESLGRGLGFLQDFRSQADVAASRLGDVDPGLARTEALLSESAQRQRDAARGVGLGELDIDRYRSDYMTAVADPALADVERQLQKDIRQLGAQEAQYGQGRGSRGAILEAELRGAAGRTRSDILGQVGRDAYQSALATAQQQQQAQYGADVADVDRQARAAAALAGLGQAEQAAAIGGRGALSSMYGDVAGRSLAGAATAGDITRQLGDITSQRLAGVGQAGALTSQLADIAGQRLGAAGQATNIAGQRLGVAQGYAAAPNVYGQFAGQFGQLGESAFGRRMSELEALAGVGQERRGLEQQQIAADMMKFAEEDPMANIERYLQTVYAAPTTGVTRVQKPGFLQRAIGMTTALAGAASDAGNAAKSFGFNQGGGISSLAMGGSPDFSGVKDPLARSLYEGKITAEEFKRLDKERKQYSTFGNTDNVPKTIEGLTKDLSSDDVKNQVQEKFQVDLVASGGDSGKMSDDTQVKGGKGAAGIDMMSPKTLSVDNSRMFGRQEEARARLRARSGSRYNYGGGIANLQEGSSPNVFSRILSSVGEGLGSLVDTGKEAFTTYSEEIDPFRNFSRDDRMRIGLSILATQPELGESSLGSISRGALAGVQAAMEDQLERKDTGTKSLGTFVDNEFRIIAENLLGRQNVADANTGLIIDDLMQKAQTTALVEAQQGIIERGSALIRERAKNIFRDLMEDTFEGIGKRREKLTGVSEKKVDNSNPKRTGMNRAARGTPAAQKDANTLLEDL